MHREKALHAHDSIGDDEAPAEADDDPGELLVELRAVSIELLSRRKQRPHLLPVLVKPAAFDFGDSIVVGDRSLSEETRHEQSDHAGETVSSENVHRVVKLEPDCDSFAHKLT